MIFSQSQINPTYFVFTIDTRNLSAESSSNVQFTLPLTSTGTYNLTSAWGDGTSNHIISYNQAEVTHTYAIGGIYTIVIIGTCTAWSFLDTGDILKILNISQWGSLKLGNDAFNFTDCANLTITATDIPDLSLTNDATGMFEGTTLTNISSISRWAWSNVNFIDNIFRNNANFNQDITALFTSSLQTALNALADCTSFDQNLGSAIVTFLTDATGFLFDGKLSNANCNALLIGWAAQTLQPNVTLDLGNSHYNGAAAIAAIATLRGAPNNWVVNTGGTP